MLAHNEFDLDDFQLHMTGVVESFGKLKQWTATSSAQNFQYI